MVGDSADPIIASAAAFGAGGFDHAAALAAMLRGATAPCQSANGEYVERQGLASYLALGYVPFDVDTNVRNANSIYGSPERGLGFGGDDARVHGRRLRDRPVRRARAAATRSPTATSSHRAANWRNLYRPGSGLIEPRYASGAFPDPYDPLKGGGFVEGDAAQYTWMVPQDPAGLFRRMGGPTRAAARLDVFLRVLNAAREGPTPTTPCSATSRPWRRPGSTTGCAALEDAGGGPPRPRPLQHRARPAIPATTTSARSRPGTSSARSASTRRSRGPVRWRSPRPLFERAEVRLADRHKLTIAAAGGKPYVASLRLDGQRPRDAPGRASANSPPAARWNSRPAPAPGAGRQKRPAAALLRPRHCTAGVSLRPLSVDLADKPHDPEVHDPAATMGLLQAPPRPSPNPRRRRPRAAGRSSAAIAGLTAAAAAIRFVPLGVQSFHHDEVITVMRVLPGSFGHMLHEVVSSESNPPLYYVLAWGWAKAFGRDEWGIRSLSALIGTLTVPVGYAIGRQLSGRRVGLILMALLAFDPMLIWYSQEARSYALLVFFGALSFLFFLRALDTRCGRDLALWAVSSALALCSHYFAFFAVGIEAVWLAVALRDRWKVLLPALGLVGAVGPRCCP